MTSIAATSLARGASRPKWPRRNSARAAFTLLEVMIAAGIFFMAVFAILELVTGSLRNARRLQEPQVDCGLVMADYAQTNVMTEGDSASGDFGDLYPGYKYDLQVSTPSWATNSLSQVDIVVTHSGTEANSVSILSAYFFRDPPPNNGLKRP